MRLLLSRHRFTLVVLLLGSSLLLALLWVQQTLLVDLPHPDALYHYASAPSTNIYDRHGTLLYQITDPHQGYHTPLKLAQIPAACAEATIATEDAAFYQHPGFDTRAMLRALVTNLREGEVVSGASTITQQLARNLMFTPAERADISLTRKLREIILAWRLTQTYSKDDILTLYLNETYYGNLAYGLEAAAATYFGKSAADLDLAECALLAGLPQSPAVYNPLENLPAAEARQADVLRLMQEAGFISEAEAALAEEEPLRFAAIPFPIEAPHFVMYVRGQLERRFGLEAIYTQGLQVHTSLDLDLNRAVERAVQHRLAALSEPEDGLPPRNVRNAAVVVLQPQDGAVLAMLGSPNYFDPRIDGNVNATVALRQPGSSIKPLTYAAAFDPNLANRYTYPPLTPASLMLDVETAFPTREGRPYLPQNYDRTWHGPVLLRESLANSLNLVAVKVLQHIGLETLTDLALQLGITTLNDEDERFGLALTLGGGEVRLLELSGAYAALANGGRKVEPATIMRVTDAAGQIRYQRATDPGPQVLDPRAVFLTTDILSDNHARAAAFGEGSPLRLDRPAAAKTGTTTDFRDNWTIGYTPDYVTGVWVGNADNEPMRLVSGITGAAPIWRDVMNLVHGQQAANPFSRPDGLEKHTVCAINGLLPSDGCRTIDEWFIAGTEPQQRDTWHRQLAIDKRTGLLAGPGCAEEFVHQRWFIVYPPEAAAWVTRNPTRQPPERYSELCPARSDGLAALPAASELAGPGAQELLFRSPHDGAVYRLNPAIPADVQKLEIAVQPGSGVVAASLQVRHNGRLLSDGPDTVFWPMEPGRHAFEAFGTTGDGRPVQTHVVIEVR